MAGIQTVPLSDALEALIASGNHEAAAALALRAAKREALSPSDPDEPGQRDYLTLQELRALSPEDMARLQAERPDVLDKSLAMTRQKPLSADASGVVQP